MASFTISPQLKGKKILPDKLFSFSLRFVPSINRQQKVLNVHLPEGLLEVYTEEANTLADDDDTETE